MRTLEQLHKTTEIGDYSVEWNTSKNTWELYHNLGDGRKLWMGSGEYQTALIATANRIIAMRAAGKHN